MIRAGILEPGKVYNFQFIARTTTGAISLDRISTKVNEVPSGGTFSVTPTSGPMLEPIFTFSALNWADEDLPLKYSSYSFVVLQHFSKSYISFSFFIFIFIILIFILFIFIFLFFFTFIFMQHLLWWQKMVRKYC